MLKKILCSGVLAIALAGASIGATVAPAEAGVRVTISSGPSYYGHGPHYGHGPYWGHRPAFYGPGPWYWWHGHRYHHRHWEQVCTTIWRHHHRVTVCRPAWRYW